MTEPSRRRPWVRGALAIVVSGVLAGGAAPATWAQDAAAPTPPPEVAQFEEIVPGSGEGV